MAQKSRARSRADSEVYFEITVVGSSARIAAVDAANGIEIAAVAPARTSLADMKKLAFAKLKARLARERP